jgi:hypothetical protein
VQTAALILAWFQHTDDLAAVIENAVATVQVPPPAPAIPPRGRAQAFGIPRHLRHVPKVVPHIRKWRRGRRFWSGRARTGWGMSCG